MTKIPKNGSALATMLVQMDEEGAHPDEMLLALRQTTDSDLLLSAAGDSVHCLTAMRMLFRRLLELQTARERASGYLALAYLFEGSDETAVAIVGEQPPDTRDAVLWQAWALTSWDPQTQFERLRLGLGRCRDPKPLWRQIASTALQAGAEEQAREAHEWLIAHENNSAELERLRSTAMSRGWT